MSRFGRSLGTKLALLFTGITAIAFAAVFFAVVPPLQSSLENQRLTELRRVAPTFNGAIEGSTAAGRPYAPSTCTQTP